jgi:hypothetical protein
VLATILIRAFVMAIWHPGCQEIARMRIVASTGVLAPVDRLANALPDPAHPRDGVGHLDGEPIFQPAGLPALL